MRGSDAARPGRCAMLTTLLLPTPEVFSHFPISTSTLIYSLLFPPILQRVNENSIEHSPRSVHPKILHAHLCFISLGDSSFQINTITDYTQFLYATLWIYLYLHKIFFAQFSSSMSRSASHRPHYDSSHNYCDFYNNYFWKTISNVFISSLADYIDLNVR
jgi:hypothetical protein